jgi:hypothetical protein
VPSSRNRSMELQTAKSLSFYCSGMLVERERSLSVSSKRAFDRLTSHALCYRPEDPPKNPLRCSQTPASEVNCRSRCNAEPMTEPDQLEKQTPLLSYESNDKHFSPQIRSLLHVGLSSYQHKKSQTQWFSFSRTGNHGFHPQKTLEALNDEYPKCGDSR